MAEASSQNEPGLDQRRAIHALKALKDVESKLENDKTILKLYRSYVDRLGPAVLINGLGQAMASELAASSGQGSGKAHQLLADEVASWLCDPNDGVFFMQDEQNPAKAVLEKLCESPQASYVRAQAESLAWLTWHKKFARALIEDDNVEAAG